MAGVAAPESAVAVEDRNLGFAVENQLDKLLVRPLRCSNECRSQTFLDLSGKWFNSIFLQTGVSLHSDGLGKMKIWAIVRLAREFVYSNLGDFPARETMR